jgi:signal peptidase
MIGFFGVCVMVMSRYLPYFGMVTIKLTDHPSIKFLLVGLMGLFVITAKE